MTLIILVVIYTSTCQETGKITRSFPINHALLKYQPLSPFHYRMQPTQQYLDVLLTQIFPFDIHNELISMRCFTTHKPLWEDVCTLHRFSFQINLKALRNSASTLTICRTKTDKNIWNKIRDKNIKLGFKRFSKMVRTIYHCNTIPVTLFPFK